MEVTSILRHRYHQATKWSNRNKKTGYFSVLRQRIKRFLVCLSGNDIIAMLSDVLDKNEITNLQNKYVNALINLSESVNNIDIIKQKSKHHFIRPLRQAELSLAEINELGFNCCNDLWKSCLNTNERHLGGKPRLSNMQINLIKEHMENISNIAANRTVKIRCFSERNPYILYKKRKTNETYESARYRQTTYNEAYKQFKSIQNINNQRILRNVHFSTFYKYVDNRFKKPFRCTDLCHYCEFGKDILREIKIIIKRNSDYVQDFTSDNLLEYFRNKLHFCIDQSARENITSTINQISDLKSIEYHKHIAKRQRTAYNTFRLNPILLEGHILIDIDYKQKIILGQGPRVLNAEFFEANKKKVICLGFGIYFVDTRSNYKFVNCLNIDVISDYDGQNASDLIKVFKFVMDTDSFKRVDKPKYIIWSDCGKQFRCAEFLYFLFNDLAEKGKSVNLNFFAEKHGKNMRDQHFSVITRALQKHTFLNQTRLKSAHDVVNILNQSAIYLNEDKLAENMSVSESIAIYFNPENQIVLRNKRIIQDLNCYYNFQNIKNQESGEFELFSAIFSDCSLLTPIDSVIETINEKFKNLQNPNANRLIETTNEERRLIIENNITNKRIRIAYIAQLSKSTGYELNIDDDSTYREPSNTQQQFANNTQIPIVRPIFCVYNCETCTSPTNYSVEDIKKTNFISQIKLNDELFLHRHKKSFIMPKTRKNRNVNEAKAELLAHYKFAHNIA